MEILADFLTSKLALGIFSSAMLCLAILFAKNIGERMKSEQMIVNMKMITETLQRIMASPWDYTVQISFLDRQPVTFVLRGEVSQHGQILTVEDAEHHECRRFLQTPCIINGGLFEIEVKNPALVVCEKRDSNVSLRVLHAFDSD